MPLRPKPDCRFRLLRVVWLRGQCRLSEPGEGDTGGDRLTHESGDKNWRLNVVTKLKPSILLLVGLATLFAAYAGAQPGLDVTGTWTGSTSSGANTITLVLQQADNKLTGTLTGAGEND